VLIVAGLAVGCARTQPSVARPVAAVQCEDRARALHAAHEFAAQTEQSDGVTLRLDETRVSNESDRWKIWTLVGKGRPFVGEEASLVVRKSDCAADWQLILYQM
jgi:hypothetical protein